MPHLTLEYTRNYKPRADLVEIFKRLHDVLEDASVRRENCKSRALERDVYFVAGGEPGGGFVHLDVRMVAGKSEEQKRQIGFNLLAALRELWDWSEESGLQLTVEISEVDRSVYFKLPEGTLGRG